MLPTHDMEYIADVAPGHSVSSDAGMICVVIPGFELGDGFDAGQADLMLRLAPGYPDVPPDMWWFNPPVRRPDNQAIPATEAREYHLGREWQRWSRHLTAGQWRSGVDSLQSFLAIVRRELAAAAQRTAA